MKYTDNNITFNNVKSPNTIVPGVLGRQGRLSINDDEVSEIDSEKSLINAIDIDWNGADMGDNIEINTTTDLLNYIKSNSGQGGGSNSGNGTYYLLHNYYKWYRGTPQKPTVTQLLSQWTENTAPNRPDTGYILWMCYLIKKHNANGDVISNGDVYGPIRFSGEDGTPGEDGFNREYIYKRFETEQEFGSGYYNPANWPLSLNNDYLGPNSFQWLDHPEGVDELYKFEYVSYRDKIKGHGWGEFSAPTIWSHYGVNGTDGDGVEYVFVRTSGNIYKPYIVQSNNVDEIENEQKDGYLPIATIEYNGKISGKELNDSDQFTVIEGAYRQVRCTDDPVGVTNDLRYEWVISRKKKNGKWEKYSEKTFSLWSYKALDGANSVSFENGYLIVNGIRYKIEVTGGLGLELYNISDLNSNEDPSVYILGTYQGNLYYWNGSKWIQLGEANNSEVPEGSKLYGHIAYADFVETLNNVVTSVEGFTRDSGSKNKKWFGICIDGNLDDPPEWSAYKWQYTKGADGNGVEFIYCLTDGTKPGISTESYANIDSVHGDPNKDEFYPKISGISGSKIHSSLDGLWSDDPVDEVSKDWPKLWWTSRKKVNGLWSEFGKITPIETYSEGIAVDYEIFYKWSDEAPNDYPPGNDWNKSIHVANIYNKEKLYYMGRNLINGVQEVDTNGDPKWDGPTEVNPSGEDGTYYEFIYLRSATPISFSKDQPNDPENPATWDTVSIDKYLGPNGSNWTDHPLGIGYIDNTFYKYEYASIRVKTNGVWNLFVDPFPWSVYGDKGTDGDGYEYIYKLSDTNPGKPINTLGAPNDWEDPHGLYLTLSEYVDEIADWEDNPQTPTSESGKSKCWVSTRRKTNGVWQPFSDSAEWSRYTKDGDSGYYPETITKEWEAWSNLDSTANESTPPTTLNNLESDWLENGTPQKPNNPEFKHLWRRSLICDLQSDKTYIGRKINGVLDYKYIRLSGTSGTEINLKAKGTVLYILPSESSSDYTGAFNTVGNGELFIIDNVKAVYKKTGNLKTVEISGNDISNGDCYTIQKSSIINESDVKGHLFMWSDEADADGNWIDLGQFQGEEGKTYYTNILWASKLEYQNNVLTSVIGVSVSPSSEKDYMGIYISESLIEDVSILDDTILLSIPWKYIRGPKGTDGVYREWIYSYSNSDNPNNKVSGRIHGEGNLTSDKSLNDWVPEGFKDSPLGISENNKTEYTWYRDKDIITNAWEDFQGPITWAKWGDRGTDGDGVEYVFIRTKSNNPPSIADIQNYDGSNGSAADEYYPLIKKIDGLDIEGGVVLVNNIEYVKCTDDPTGVTEIYLYEWVAKRKKSAAVNGVRTWNNYLGKMSLWAKWSEDGLPGYTIEADRNIILNEDISTPGSFIPITSYLRVKKGSIDCSFTYSIDRDKIPPVNAAISEKYLTVTSNLPSLQTTTHSYKISGVLNNDDARAISNYTFDIVLNILDPDTSSTFDYTISINVAVNYLGTWRTTIIGDVETNVAKKITYGYNNETGAVNTLQAVGKYIRSSERNISQLTNTVNGVVEDMSEIEQTSKKISLSVYDKDPTEVGYWQLLKNPKFKNGTGEEALSEWSEHRGGTYLLSGEYFKLNKFLSSSSSEITQENADSRLTQDIGEKVESDKWYTLSFESKFENSSIGDSTFKTNATSWVTVTKGYIFLIAGKQYNFTARGKVEDEGTMYVRLVRVNNYDVINVGDITSNYETSLETSFIPKYTGIYELLIMSGSNSYNATLTTWSLPNLQSVCVFISNNVLDSSVKGFVDEEEYLFDGGNTIFLNVESVYKKHVITFKTKSSITAGDLRFCSVAGNGRVFIHHPRLERGLVAHDFEETYYGLKRTGIDVENGKITAVTDNFEIQNSNGDTTFSVDKDGNIIGSGNATFAGNVSASNIYSPNIFESICVGGDLCSYVVLEENNSPEIKYHRVYYCGENIEGRKYSYSPPNGFYYTENDPYDEKIIFKEGKYYSDTILKLYKFFTNQNTLWQGNFTDINVFTKCTGNSNRILLSKINNNTSFVPIVLPRPEDYKGKIIKIHVYLYTQPSLADLVAVNVTCIGKRMAEVLQTSSDNNYPTFNENTAKETITIQPLKVCIGYNGSDLEYIYPSFNSEFISVKGIVDRVENWYWTHMNTYSTT